MRRADPLTPAQVAARSLPPLTAAQVARLGVLLSPYLAAPAAKPTTKAEEAA